MVNLVFFGDSVCFGQYVSLHKCWVTKVAQKLAETLGEDAVCVTNSSVNGNTTRQALERMSYDLSGLKPDILTVQFGLNDCNKWDTDRGAFRVSPAAFHANLEEIVLRADIFGVKTTILTTNHPTLRPKEYEDGNKLYNKTIRSIAHLRGIPLLDIETYFTVNDIEGHVLPDGLHLNEHGHQVYFKQVYPIIERRVKELL